jgi:hypothetical protein
MRSDQTASVRPPQRRSHLKPMVHFPLLSIVATTANSSRTRPPAALPAANEPRLDRIASSPLARPLRNRAGLPLRLVSPRGEVSLRAYNRKAAATRRMSEAWQRPVIGSGPASRPAARPAASSANWSPSPTIPETCKVADAGLSHLPSFAGSPGRGALVPRLRGKRNSANRINFVAAAGHVAVAEPAHRRELGATLEMLV